MSYLKFQILLELKKQVGDLSQVAKIANLCKENLAIYSGNDDQVLPVLSLGGIRSNFSFI